MIILVFFKEGDMIDKKKEIYKIILILGILLIFNFILFPTLLGNMGNIKPLDLKFAYTPNTAYKLIDNYSDSFRYRYILNELSLDLIYPIIYSTLLSWLIIFLFKSQKLAIYPYIIMLVDYLENIGVVILLYKYPQKFIAIAWITSFFSTLKWLLIVVVVLAIICGSLKIPQNRKM